MTPDQDERLVTAFELLASGVQSIAASLESGTGSLVQMADALEFYAMTEEARFAVEHPLKPEPREVEITHLKTEEEIIREQLGGEDAGDNLGDWLTIPANGGGDRWSAGPREKAYRQQPVEEQGGGAPRTPGTGTGEVPG